MTPSLALRAFIVGWEAMRLTAYDDGRGVWTIGVGHTEDVAQGDTCTEEQALAWLEEDLTSHGDKLLRYMTRTPAQQQFDALLSLAFNVGVRVVGESGTLARFNAGLDQECADRFLLWDKVAGKVWPGLTKRRAAERLMYLDGDYSGRP